jgi:glyoxylase-like metal-dependent hydrolase (beta-lactamase superfamily II)
MRTRTPLLAVLLSAAALNAQVVQTGDPIRRGLSASDFPRARALVPGVYSYEALRSGDPGRQMTTVSLIVVTSDGVLVADGQGNVAQTREMVDWIHKTTTQPIRYVIICSDHGDHTGGNAAFPAGAVFVASPVSKKVLDRAGREPLPTETVSDRRALKLGTTTIEILNLGRAHTGGDLSVYLPDQRVLFMSEAYLHAIFPAMRSAYPSEWIQTIRKAEAMNAAWYVPGHGFVDDASTLKADLVTFRLATERVVGEATRLHDARVPCVPSPAPAGGGPRPLCEAARQGNWGDLASWTLFGSQVETAVRRVYDELDGKLP